MTRRKGDPPYVYVYLYSRFKEWAKTYSWPFVRPSKLLEVMRRVLPRVPGYLHYPILCQMEEYGFIRRINKKKYQILESDEEKILLELKDFTFW